MNRGWVVGKLSVFQTVTWRFVLVFSLHLGFGFFPPHAFQFMHSEQVGYLQY